MMKIKQVLLSLLLISIVFSCSRKPKQEEKINTIESIKKEEQLTVDKEKLKQLSITISIDSIDKLLSYYSVDSSNNFFYTFDQLNLLGFKDLFYLSRYGHLSDFEIGKINETFAERYCLINFQQYNQYWSIYLLSQRFPKYEDGYYCGSVIHLITFDSTNKFINAVQIVRNASDAMNDLIEWCNFKILSDTSFSISIIKRYFDSFDSEHTKDYYRTFDSTGYTLLVDKRGHFYQLKPYSVHGIRLDLTN